MKKQRSFLIIKIVLLTAVIGGLLYAMNAGAARLNQGQEAESMKQLENSMRKATMTCYATEGVYPPTLEYLKKNYGIQIDESRFTVFYEVFAKNLMPEITVMENQERVD